MTGNTLDIWSLQEEILKNCDLAQGMKQKGALNKMKINIATSNGSMLFARNQFDEAATGVELGGLTAGAGYAIQLSIDMESCVGEHLLCRTDDGTIYALHMENGDAGNQIVFTFHTQGEAEPFRLASPVGQNVGTVDLVLWVSDVYAAMYVNGELADEEWPLGAAAWTLPARLTADRNIRNLVICSYSDPSSADFLPRKEAVLISRGLQYWRPEGHNTGVGDCMPFWHDGVFHLFYLFDRRRHKSKHGFGAHQWAHVSSPDLVHWADHEMAIPITEQWEGSICTGSVFFHDGIYYAYYSARMSDRSAARLSVSTSADGRHFRKNPPLTSLQAPYDGPSARDPVVFADDEGLFHMLVTTSLEDYPLKRRNGCLAHLTSADLWHWQQQPTFIIPGYTDQPECADFFHWNGWYYLVFSNNGIARYRMSRNSNGPWIKPANDMLNCPNVTVPKTARFGDNRRISVGFLHDDHKYASCTVFRELLQNPDGSLGSRFVPEMLATKPECAYEVIPLTRDVTVSGSSVTLQNQEGFSAAALTGLPLNKRITLTAVSDGAVFGLCLKSDAEYAAGTEFFLDPHRGKAGFRPCNDNSYAEYGHDSIYNLDALGVPVTLDIIVTDYLIDVCIGGKRTVITKSESTDTDVVCLFTQCGTVVLQDINVSPL